MNEVLRTSNKGNSPSVQELIARSANLRSRAQLRTIVAGNVYQDQIIAQAMIKSTSNPKFRHVSPLDI